MATLAGILVVVAYNMSEWKNFISVLKGTRSDAAVLITTFLLTVLIDLTVAIEIGMVLAVFLFMRKMIKFSGVNVWTNEDEDNDDMNTISFPPDVEIFEISGPLFFGAAYKFKDAMNLIEKPPKVLVIRMKHVPVIDATGIKTIEEVFRGSTQQGTRIILSEVNSLQVRAELKKSRLMFAIGKANITDTFEQALERADYLLKENQQTHRSI